MLQQLALRGSYFWSAWNEQLGVFGNAFLIGTTDGFAAIDPLPLDEPSYRRIEELGGVSVVCSTIRERAEAALAFAQRFGARVVSSFQDGDIVAPGIVALALKAQRERDAWALWMPESRTVYAGDALLGVPAGALSMHDAPLYLDIRRAALELRRILSRDPMQLLLAYGQSILDGAYGKLYQLLYMHAGMAIHRVNVDELDFRDLHDEGEPMMYACRDAEVGFTIGARGLGYRATTLQPGKRFCPLHTHAREEELLFVLDGEPSVRTATETIRCRKGDFVAFPIGETGTHQVLNESDTPATFILLARTEWPEVCRYPDSRKLLVDLEVAVEAGRPAYMIADGPQLEYYAGEGST